MHKLFNIFLCVISLGLFLNPTELSACAMHSKAVKGPIQTVCDHNLDHQDKPDHNKKDCCHKKATHDDDCTGSCGNKSCHGSNPTSLYVQQLGKDIQTPLYATEKNTYPSYQQPNYYAGVISIWQPPKIG